MIKLLPAFVLALLLSFSGCTEHVDTHSVNARPEIQCGRVAYNICLDTFPGGRHDERDTCLFYWLPRLCSQVEVTP